jgi:LysM repeat protein
VATILSVASAGLKLAESLGKGGYMQKGEQQVCERIQKIISLGILLCGGWLVSGCVVLEEKHNAEKARSLNFQRLLAQEEKRTAELDSEVRHVKAELSEFEARNRELSAQVQVAREQMGRLQEEAEAIREATVLERKALEDMQRKGQAPLAKPKKAELPKAVSGGHSGGHLSDKGMAALTEPASPMKVTPGMVHVVKAGETLYSISRRYGVEVDKLKKSNKLPDDIVEIGQKILVGAE